MLRIRAVVVLDEASYVRSDAFAAVDELDGAPGRADPHRFADQGVGDRVEVIVEGDVIIDVDADFLPLGVFVGWVGRALRAGWSSRS